MKVNQRTVSALLFAAALAIIAIANIYTLTHSDTAFETPSPERLKKIYPEAHSFRADSASGLPCMAALDAAGNEIGAVFLSDRLPPVVRGYSGNISVLAAFDRRGTIKGVDVLKHSETPSYFSMLKKASYLKRFEGRNVGDDFSDIDAVSGATITSEALKKDLVEGARLLALQRYAIESPSSQGFAVRDWMESAAVAALLILAAAAYSMRRRRLRQATMLASLAILGLWLNHSLNMQQIASLLSFSSPAGSTALLLLFFFALATAFARRQIYCNMLCPYGALQEFMYSLIPFRLAPSLRLVLAASRLKFLLLFVIVCAFFALGSKAVLTLEPFGAVFQFSAAKAHIAFAVAVLIVSGFYKRFFCRCLCPSGACLQLAAKAIPTLRAASGKSAAAEDAVGGGAKFIQSRRDIIFIVLLIAALAGSVALGIYQQREIIRQESGASTETRNFEKVNIERIREGVYNNNLSDIKARHWESTEKDE